MASETENNFGVDPSGWAPSKILQAVFLYHFIYPLHILPIIGFFHDHSWLWIVNTLILWPVYYVVSNLFYYIYSYKQIFYFNKYYLGKNRKFDLYRIDGATEALIDESEFSYILSKVKLAEQVYSKNRHNTQDFEAMKSPINFFYAQPRESELLGSCKAYVYIPGLLYIVNRTTEFKKTIFEEFLINHELEHINNRGLLNLRSVVRSQYLVWVHMIIFSSFITKPYQIIMVILYLVGAGFDRFIRLEAAREAVADNRALLKIKDKSDRLKIINILIKVFNTSISSKSTSAFIRYSANFRLSHAVAYKYIQEKLISEELDDNIWPVLRTMYYVNNQLVSMAAIPLIALAINWYASPVDFLLIMLLIALLSIVITSVFVIKSRKIYFYMHNKVRGIPTAPVEI